MEEKQNNFLIELSGLLKKYNCEIALEDFGRAHQTGTKLARLLLQLWLYFKFKGKI